MVWMICSPIVKLGLSEVIGSWKIIASRLPRRSRRVSSGTSSRSTPSKRTEPVTSAECFDSRPMIASHAEVDTVDGMGSASIVAMEDDA